MHAGIANSRHNKLRRACGFHDENKIHIHLLGKLFYRKSHCMLGRNALSWWEGMFSSIETFPVTAPSLARLGSSIYIYIYLYTYVCVCIYIYKDCRTLFILFSIKLLINIYILYIDVNFEIFIINCAFNMAKTRFIFAYTSEDKKYIFHIDSKIIHACTTYRLDEVYLFVVPRCLLSSQMYKKSYVFYLNLIFQ